MKNKHRHEGGTGVRAYSRVSRREFLRGAAAAGGVLASGGVGSLLAQDPTLPSPDASGIEHIVVVMMENRSFDHLLGWLRGADGRQAGLRYVDAAGVPHRTYRLAPDFQGCGHSGSRSLLRRRAHRVQRRRVRRLAARGRQRRVRDRLLHQEGPRPSSPARRTRWTICDRYFSAIMAGTFAEPHLPARRADRPPRQHVRAVARCRRSGIGWRPPGSRGATTSATCRSWRCGAASTCRSRARSATFFADAAAGTLPHVSFVEPRFLGEEVGTVERRPSVRRHPQRTGVPEPRLLAPSRRARPGRTRCSSSTTTNGAASSTTSRRQSAPIPPADQAAGNEDGLLGFRTPMSRRLAVRAARARSSRVARSHVGAEDDRVALGSGAADGARRDREPTLAEVLDFRAPDYRAKQLDVPTGPFGQLCVPGLPDVTDAEWRPLLEMAADFGWPVQVPQPVS